MYSIYVSWWNIKFSSSNDMHRSLVHCVKKTQRADEPMVEQHTNRSWDKLTSVACSNQSGKFPEGVQRAPLRI